MRLVGLNIVKKVISSWSMLNNFNFILKRILYNKGRLNHRYRIFRYHPSTCAVCGLFAQAWTLWFGIRITKGYCQIVGWIRSQRSTWLSSFRNDGRESQAHQFLPRVTNYRKRVVIYLLASNNAIIPLWLQWSRRRPRL